jgi:hypothetical protein
MPVMMVAGLYNFITSLGKLMASQQVFIAILRICTCIIGLGLLDVLLIGITSKQNKLIRLLINYYTNSASILYKEMLHLIKEDIKYYRQTFYYSILYCHKPLSLSVYKHNIHSQVIQHVIIRQK